MMALAPGPHQRSPGTLELLRKLHPPQSVIHVGAGKGSGEMHQWRQWQVPHAWIIEASADRLQWAERFAGEHPQWHVINAVVSDCTGEGRFHQATNPDEDSLLRPEQLASLWPNLQTATETVRATCRLDQVVEECGKPVPAPWLLIDCLPAQPILKGAGALLDDCSVVWLRTMLTPLAGVDDRATLAALEHFLNPLGFHCIEIMEGNHPALGHALFVRDWRATLQQQIAQQAQASSEQTREHNELQAEIARLIAENDALGKLANDRQIQLDGASSSRDEQARLATECQLQLDGLGRNLATLEEAVAALDKQRDELQKEVNLLTTARDEQSRLAAQWKTELDVMQKRSHERDGRIAELEAELSEHDARQQLFNDEMTRAEAQIDLIKDLLFREPGL